MRTPEKFNTTWQEMVWWLNFHKSPVWLVATEDKYCLSVIKPEPKDLPFGTAANLYDVDLEIIDCVVSNK